MPVCAPIPNWHFLDCKQDGDVPKRVVARRDVSTQNLVSDEFETLRISPLASDASSTPHCTSNEDSRPSPVNLLKRLIVSGVGNRDPHSGVRRKITAVRSPLAIECGAGCHAEVAAQCETFSSNHYKVKAKRSSPLSELILDRTPSLGYCASLEASQPLHDAKSKLNSETRHSVGASRILAKRSKMYQPTPNDFIDIEKSDSRLNTPLKPPQYPSKLLCFRSITQNELESFEAWISLENYSRTLHLQSSSLRLQESLKDARKRGMTLSAMRLPSTNSMFSPGIEAPKASVPVQRKKTRPIDLQNLENRENRLYEQACIRSTQILLDLKYSYANKVPSTTIAELGTPGLDIKFSSTRIFASRDKVPPASLTYGFAEKQMRPNTGKNFSKYPSRLLCRRSLARRELESREAWASLDNDVRTLTLLRSSQRLQEGLDNANKRGMTLAAMRCPTPSSLQSPAIEAPKAHTPSMRVLKRPISRGTLYIRESWLLSQANIRSPYLKSQSKKLDIYPQNAKVLAERRNYPFFYQGLSRQQKSIAKRGISLSELVEKEQWSTEGRRTNALLLPLETFRKLSEVNKRSGSQLAAYRSGLQTQFPSIKSYSTKSRCSRSTLLNELLSKEQLLHTNKSGRSEGLLSLDFGLSQIQQRSQELSKKENFVVKARRSLIRKPLAVRSTGLEVLLDQERKLKLCLKEIELQAKLAISQTSHDSLRVQSSVLKARANGVSEGLRIIASRKIHNEAPVLTLRVARRNISKGNLFSREESVDALNARRLVLAEHYQSLKLRKLSLGHQEFSRGSVIKATRRSLDDFISAPTKPSASACRSITLDVLIKKESMLMQKANNVAERLHSGYNMNVPGRTRSSLLKSLGKDDTIKAKRALNDALVALDHTMMGRMENLAPQIDKFVRIAYRHNDNFASLIDKEDRVDQPISDMRLTYLLSPLMRFQSYMKQRVVGKDQRVVAARLPDLSLLPDTLTICSILSGSLCEVRAITPKSTVAVRTDSVDVMMKKEQILEGKSLQRQLAVFGPMYQRFLNPILTKRTMMRSQQRLVAKQADAAIFISRTIAKEDLDRAENRKESLARERLSTLNPLDSGQALRQNMDDIRPWHANSPISKNARLLTQADGRPRRWLASKTPQGDNILAENIAAIETLQFSNSHITPTDTISSQLRRTSISNEDDVLRARISALKAEARQKDDVHRKREEELVNQIREMREQNVKDFARYSSERDRAVSEALRNAHKVTAAKLQAAMKEHEAELQTIRKESFATGYLEGQQKQKETDKVLNNQYLEQLENYQQSCKELSSDLQSEKSLSKRVELELEQALKRISKLEEQSLEKDHHITELSEKLKVKESATPNLVEHEVDKKILDKQLREAQAEILKLKDEIRSMGTKYDSLEAISKLNEQQLHDVNAELRTELDRTLQALERHKRESANSLRSAPERTAYDLDNGFDKPVEQHTKEISKTIKQNMSIAPEYPEIVVAKATISDFNDPHVLTENFSKKTSPRKSNSDRRLSLSELCLDRTISDELSDYRGAFTAKVEESHGIFNELEKIVPEDDFETSDDFTQQNDSFHEQSMGISLTPAHAFPVSKQDGGSPPQLISGRRTSIAADLLAELVAAAQQLEEEDDLPRAQIHLDDDEDYEVGEIEKIIQEEPEDATSPLKGNSEADKPSHRRSSLSHIQVARGAAIANAAAAAGRARMLKSGYRRPSLISSLTRSPSLALMMSDQEPITASSEQIAVQVNAAVQEAVALEHKKWRNEKKELLLRITNLEKEKAAIDEIMATFDDLDGDGIPDWMQEDDPEHQERLVAIANGTEIPAPKEPLTGLPAVLRGVSQLSSIRRASRAASLALGTAAAAAAATSANNATSPVPSTLPVEADNNPWELSDDESENEELDSSQVVKKLREELESHKMKTEQERGELIQLLSSTQRREKELAREILTSQEQLTQARQDITDMQNRLDSEAAVSKAHLSTAEARVGAEISVIQARADVEAIVLKRKVKTLTSELEAVKNSIGNPSGEESAHLLDFSVISDKVEQAELAELRLALIQEKTKNLELEKMLAAKQPDMPQSTTNRSRIANSGSAPSRTQPILSGFNRVSSRQPPSTPTTRVPPTPFSSPASGITRMPYVSPYSARALAAASSTISSQNVKTSGNNIPARPESSTTSFRGLQSRR